jgi:RNA polymerase sigma factor (sigma-70 family)
MRENKKEKKPMNELTINVENYINLIRKICWDFLQTGYKANLDFQDCVQECCLRILEQKDKYNSKWKQSTFIHKICENHLTNLVRNLYRKKRTIIEQLSNKEYISNDPRKLPDSLYMLELTPLELEIIQLFEQKYNDGKSLKNKKVLQEIYEQLNLQYEKKTIVNAIAELKKWYLSL